MSDTTFFLVPKRGLVVRDPITREPLPELGAEKPRSIYWRRRLAQGDVTVGTPSAVAPAKAPAAVAPAAPVAPAASAPVVAKPSTK